MATVFTAKKHVTNMSTVPLVLSSLSLSHKVFESQTVEPATREAGVHFSGRGKILPYLRKGWRSLLSLHLLQLQNNPITLFAYYKRWQVVADIAILIMSH